MRNKVTHEDKYEDPRKYAFTGGVARLAATAITGA